MKLTPQDWRKLQYSMLVLGLVLVMLAVLLWLSNNYLVKKWLALQVQKSQLGQARAKYQASGLEKQTIIENLPKYQQLINHGFVGEERRIEWVEALRQTNLQYKLFSIDYSIGQQEAYKASFLPNLGSFTLHRSVMKLDFPMLHEGDILSLVDGLHAYQTTPFIVRDCTMTRQSKVVNIKTLTPNLRAKCELDWLTLREPTIAQVTP